MTNSEVSNVQTISSSMPAASDAGINIMRNHVEQLVASKQLADAYCATEMVPTQYRGKPDSGAVAIMWGAEIGLAPLQALQNIAVINGTPALWGDALPALVRGSGQCEYITTSYDTVSQTSTVKTKRKDQPEEIRTYSMADASRAGLAGRETYKRHPQRMLQARARSHLLRDVYADLLHGFQIAEVLTEDNEAYNIDGRQEVDITPQTDSETINTLLAEPKLEANYSGMIAASNTAKDLAKVGGLIARIAAGTKKDSLRNEYIKRQKEIKDGDSTG